MVHDAGFAHAGFSQPTALWCPYCRRPFIGTIRLADGEFLHEACGQIAALDIDRLTDLARQPSDDAWFWDRYRARLFGEVSGANDEGSGRARYGGPGDGADTVSEPGSSSQTASARRASPASLDRRGRGGIAPRVS